ncbi:MAG: hypothetical protein FGM37_03400 [Phycisphaerales bacterium]|nr:hypothetical protein [Phycisphaerales bacterium]
MRAIAACALPALLVACPVACSVISAAVSGEHEGSRIELAELVAGWRGTLTWSVPVAMASAILGWMPGRVLHARLRAGKGALLAIAVAWVALVPPYALFYCGWRLFRPGVWLADWAATHGHVGAARACALALALMSWLWPIAAIAVAALAPRHRAGSDDLARLDRCTWSDRIRLAWRRDWPALAAAALAMIVALVGETTAFDVAQVLTASSELRLLDAAGADGATLWRVAAAPSAVTLALVVGIFALWRRLSARRDPQEVASAEPLRCSGHARTHACGIGFTSILVCGALIVPMALLVLGGSASGGWGSFSALHGSAAAGTLCSAAIGGALGALAGGVTCVAALGSRGAAPVLLCGLVWAAGAALPGVLLASAYESMWNGLPALRTVYDSMLLVPMAQVAHAGLACWMIACLMAGMLPREAIDVERLHGGGLRSLLRAHAPCVCASALGGGAVMAAHCASETVIASRLTPPGAERIAPMLMSAIHYQDQSAVLAALPWMGVMAAGMAALCVVSWSWAARGARARPTACRAVPLLMACVSAAWLVGCDGRSAESSAVQRGGAADQDAATGRGAELDPLDRGGAGFGAMSSEVTVSADAPAPLACEQVIGMRGRMPGRLDYPRAADVSPDGSIAVIDKSGRVQRFAPDGRVLGGWRMPRTGNGMPTGVTIDAHGRLWIADTHEHRVLVCDSGGTELGSFGTYGRAGGEFIYPTDVLVLDDADPARCSVVVSEYGGNDRLQWFEVTLGAGKAAASAVRSVGTQGSGTEQFLRPQSMSRMPDGAIAVADACNHRIVMLSSDGQWLRTLGTAGRELGQLSYPYGVMSTGSGAVIVAEFGNNRIQCLGADGRGVWVRGGGGRETGRLVAPWAVVGDASAPIVVDAGNCRLVRVRLPSEGER